MNRLLKSFLALALCSFFFAAVMPVAYAAPTTANVVIPSDLGLTATAKKARLNTADSVPKLVGRIIGTALSMLAVVFFILMVYAGILWMTAHGNSDAVNKAQETMFAAIIGVVIVLGSYAITQFVFESLEPTLPDNPGNAGQLQASCIDQCGRNDQECLGQCEANADDDDLPIPVGARNQNFCSGFIQQNTCVDAFPPGENSSCSWSGDRNACEWDG